MKNSTDIPHSAFRNSGGPLTLTLSPSDPPPLKLWRTRGARGSVGGAPTGTRGARVLPESAIRNPHCARGAILYRLFAILALCSALHTPRSALGQVGLNTRTGFFTNAFLNPTSAQTLSNLVSTTSPPASTGVSSNITSQAVQVFRDRGLSIMPLQVAATASNVSSVTYTFDVSADRTNWSTTGPIQFSLPLNGITPVRGFTNISKSALDNVYWIRLTSIADANTNQVWITNVLYSVYP
jgi:hypothetical protein